MMKPIFISTVFSLFILFSCKEERKNISHTRNTFYEEMVKMCIEGQIICDTFSKEVVFHQSLLPFENPGQESTTLPLHKIRSHKDGMNELKLTLEKMRDTTFMLRYEYILRENLDDIIHEINDKGRLNCRCDSNLHQTD